MCDPTTLGYLAVGINVPGDKRPQFKNLPGVAAPALSIPDQQRPGVNPNAPIGPLAALPGVNPNLTTGPFKDNPSLNVPGLPRS